MPVAQASTATTTIDLGTLGGDFSGATDVSGDVVVGASETATGAIHAFAYDLAAATPAMADLGSFGGNSYAMAVGGDIVVGHAQTGSGVRAFAYDLGAATPAMIDLGTLGGDSYAMAVSGDIVAGHSATASGDVHGFVYDLGATTPTMVDLGTFGGDMSFAAAVHGDTVVGRSQTSNGIYRAFAYTVTSGDIVDLGTLGGDFGQATAVSGNLVAGASDTSTGGSHAFVYDLGAAAPTMIDLGTLGNNSSGANAVSGGVVVGNSGPRAFAYDLGAAAPAMVDLGNLGSGTSDESYYYYDGYSSSAADVSGTVVVGTSYTATGDRRAFAYDLGAADPSMVDLGTLGGRQSHAVAIADDVVAGAAQTTTGFQHAVAWKLPSSVTTSTGVSSSAEPAVVGEEVVYTAVVSPIPSGGTIAFGDGGTTIEGCGQQAVDTSTGAATCRVTYNQVGAHSITAEYSGSSQFAASTSSPLTQSISYAVDLLYDPTKARKGNSVPIRLQLLDAAGNNLSAAGVAVTISGLSPDPAPGITPAGTFELVQITEEELGYQFNVKTKNYPSGSYTLSFIAGGDPSTHGAAFTVR